MTDMTMDRVAAEGAGLTRTERIAKGKAARSAVPRARHAEFTRDPDRPDPLALLASQDAARVQDLLPIRYGRMALSPFSHFRGAALPMASDLAGTARTGFLVQACGDAHLLNFGLFASPERRLVFDINDFDETLPGPWEWDVKRLAASLEIAGRNNGYAPKQRRNVVLKSIAEYRRAMRELAGWPALEVWYAHADVEAVREVYAGQLSAVRRRRLADRVAKARTNDNFGALRKFTEIVDGTLRITPDAPLIVPVDQLAGSGQDPAELTSRLTAVLDAYRETLEPERRRLLDRYRLVDLARKVVGVGSVGTRCWMALLLGNDERDPLFLQVKEAGPSVLEAFLGRSRYHNAGRRVVVGQRLMQTVSDIFLGWVRVTGFDGQTRDFYFRQLRDGKGSADVETMPPGGMLGYGRLCAWTLARAHARTGDAIAIAAYLGAGSSFEAAIREFAGAYADQNERDHAALLDAIKAGRIAAEHGQ
ncbi:uncharacterized protein (DUF2252 family) [Kibdelosporangium banguiense]|uniref:Uncharacterized protein (DUF2252 family) n=1 Tax=Kibdelosporangium banguiense TaxID=1365924 RepID=A0ABS4TXK3_9PSEU|nr:DUF2252 domain-containing protein [Kibdelosporangium banguiense]MBP2328700.1 uncharacterized protein (DUF2252 family) [Kibdelosporangium banguiense]